MPLVTSTDGVRMKFPPCCALCVIILRTLKRFLLRNAHAERRSELSYQDHSIYAFAT